MREERLKQLISNSDTTKSNKNSIIKIRVWLTEKIKNIFNNIKIFKEWRERRELIKSITIVQSSPLTKKTNSDKKNNKQVLTKNTKSKKRKRQLDLKIISETIEGVEKTHQNEIRYVKIMFRLLTIIIRYKDQYNAEEIKNETYSKDAVKNTIKKLFPLKKDDSITSMIDGCNNDKKGFYRFLFQNLLNESYTNNEEDIEEFKIKLKELSERVANIDIIKNNPDEIIEIEEKLKTMKKFKK